MIPLVKVGMPAPEVLMPALQEVLYSGMVAEGAAVAEFERAFATAFGLDHVLATSSGSAALHLALLLSGVSSGDEVVSTAMTAEPTNTVIMQTGAQPIFADVDERTGNVTPESIEAALTARTRAIVVVHYAGYPVDMKALERLARDRGIKLIEDCAHALGAQAYGRAIGTLSDYALFSFQAIKHLTTVDGGALRIRDIDELPLARQMRWFGLSKGIPRTEVDIRVQGFKYNMHNVAATIGLQQLLVVPERIQMHRRNAQYFNEALRGLRGIEPALVPDWSNPSYWLYTLLADDADGLAAHLESAGITASKLHRPNQHHTVFAASRRPLPGLDRFYDRLLHIPCGWWVGEAERSRIVDAIKEYAA